MKMNEFTEGEGWTKVTDSPFLGISFLGYDNQHGQTEVDDELGWTPGI